MGERSICPALVGEKGCEILCLLTLALSLLPEYLVLSSILQERLHVKTSKTGNKAACRLKAL